MKKLFFLLLPLFYLSANAQIKVTDILKIKNITELKVSPDKSTAIYAVKYTEPAVGKPLDHEYITQLYMVNLNTPDKSKQLTFGKNSASQVSFSPEGKSIAFIRTASEKPQVFIMSLEGGEPMQLTYSAYGASAPQFSTDGSKVFFQASISYTEMLKDSVLNQGKMLPEWSLEKPGYANWKPSKAKINPDGSLEEIRAYLEKDVEDKKAKVINRLNFQGEASVEPDLKFSHIFSIGLSPNAKASPLTFGFQSFILQHVFDKELIVSASFKDIHPDRSQENQILKLDLTTLKTNVLLYKKDKNFSSVKISGDGKLLAAVMNSVNLLSYGQLVHTSLENLNIIETSVDMVPGQINWSTDNKNIFFTAPSKGAFPIFRYTVNSKNLAKLSPDSIGIGVYGLSTENKIIYAFNSMNTPNELAINNLDFSSHIKVTNLNAVWLQGKKLSKPTKGAYKNKLGQTVDYWYMPPTDFQAGKKYPLILNLHGGPTAMWGPTEASMWHEFQYLCSQGYGVVYPNPRGSGGYGKDFQFANYRDWGTGPAEDALASVDFAQKLEWVDNSKMFITGGSYAGYLVAWIIAHDHRFKAAFAQRGVYDLKTFMGEGNAWRLVPNYFGYPWIPESETKVAANSPYNFLQNIKTPLLIKHGENDLRTGVIQSEMLYKSMKILGKEVEYVRMPGGTHELSRTGDLRQRIDRILRIHEFFSRYKN